MEKQADPFTNGSNVDFESFYYQNHKLIYNYALRHLKDEEASADLVQECFTKFWHHMDRLDLQQNPRAYLFTISKHMVFDELKKKALFFRYSDYCQKHNDDLCNNNEEHQAFHELEQIYQEAIDSLPEKRQHIFRLSKLQQLSNPEIASVLNLSVNTVRDQLVKGNKHIKNYVLQRHYFISKKIFSFLIVFFTSMSVYTNKEPLLVAWTKRDFNTYTQNI